MSENNFSGIFTHVPGIGQFLTFSHMTHATRVNFLTFLRRGHYSDIFWHGVDFLTFSVLTFSVLKFSVLTFFSRLAF